jgi:hypothetical protein
VEVLKEVGNPLVVAALKEVGRLFLLLEEALKELSARLVCNQLTLAI